MKKTFMLSFVEAKSFCARCLTLLVLALLSTNLAWGEMVTYTKATSISAGDKVILVCESTKMELTSISTTSKKYGIGTLYTTSPTGTYAFDVVAGSETGSFSFKNGSNYLRWNSDNTLDAIATSIAKNSSWLVTFDDNGNATIKNANDQARVIWWNVSSPRFACYTNKSDGDDYKYVQIYKQQTKTLESISVKTAPTKTTYYVGEDLNPAGLVITASYTDESDEDIAYTEANKDAFSFSGFNSAAEATDQVITVTYAEKSATFTVNIEEARVLNSIAVASNPAKMVYEVGEALDLTGLVVNGIFSKGDPEPVDYTASPANGAILDAVGNTTVTLTSVDNTELTTSFNVTVNAIEGDRITLSETGITPNTTSYANWKNSYTATSGAVYTGNNAGGNSAIQLRSDASETKPASGIVSTTSGGYIKKVKVVWESHTAADRELEVFGSNTAYTAVADLVDNDKKGTSLGTIKNGTSTELTIDGYYAYVGVRSKSGAMYLSSITFVWGEGETYTRTVNTANIGTLCVPYAFEKPETMTLYNIVGKDESKIYFEENKEDIVAGKPYLFRSTAETITLTYTGEKAAEALTSNGLVGTYESCTITPNDGNYILSNNTLYVVDGTFNCGANRAYIHIDGIVGGAPTSAAKSFALDFDDPTGIESLTPALSEGKEVYNLNGMRVNGSYKGIVVVNGKKYINK